MLNVYRASAGSGKTYRLTFEYIKILLSPPNQSDNLLSDERKRLYRRILAVTFTNKATDEMKQRIIKELDILAHTPEKSDYLKDLLGQNGITGNIDELKAQAAEQLYTLLHDFSGFNISTIDRFFQQITRAFIHEIGISGGYNIELDSSHILTEAIDRMFFELEKDDNKDLLAWLVSFAQQQIEEDSYKSFRGQIDKLATEIFKEEYKEHQNDLHELLKDKRKIEEYIKKLNGIKLTFENDVKKQADKALALLDSANINVTDFKYGNASGAAQLTKWANGKYDTLPGSRIKSIAENDASHWFPKGTDSGTISGAKAIEAQFQAEINAIIKIYDNTEICQEYQTAIRTRKFLYTLGILNDIVTQIKNYQNDHDTLLLSDTNELLRQIINDDDTPFVYEKIGTYIDHFFIDEFQDTSVTQWKNFYPLIKDSVARGESNLIVGDVKQSIYRWRNSDWKLLNDELPNCFDKSELKENSLDTNWRSCGNVIRFNNAFFTLAASTLQDEFNKERETDSDLSHKIVSAYSDAAQKIGRQSTADSGYVEARFFSGDKDYELTAQDLILQQLAATIRDLQDRGVALSDIAILVRTKNEGNTIVQYLMKEASERDKYRYDIISDEALYISNSITVQLIIALLDYLNTPQVPLAQFMALYHIEAARTRDKKPTISGVCDKLRNDSEAILHPIEKLRGDSLYEICEKIIDLYPCDNIGNENVFIQAFLDTVLQFTNRRSSDLNSFLQWWHDKGCTQSLATPEGLDAIRIMTIHKSKGLEFSTVIIPFCNWGLDHSNQHAQILWAETPQSLNQIPFVPIKYESKLTTTSYAKAYLTEQIHSYIDNLNLAYVAFTRAKNELYIFSSSLKSNTKNIGKLLYTCLQTEMQPENLNQFPYTNLGKDFDADNGVYNFGKKESFRQDKVISTPDNIVPYRSVIPGDRLHLRLQGKSFFDGSDGRHRGTIYHDILSSINIIDDISNAVRAHILKGIITHEEGEDIEGLLRERIDTDIAREWFKPGLKVLNERDILVPASVPLHTKKRQTVYRPDRIILEGNTAIVIDYKFGEEQKQYSSQVRNYMSLLEIMGYNPKGYLWYVTEGKITEV